jgi:hypothetical protein
MERSGRLEKEKALSMNDYKDLDFGRRVDKGQSGHFSLLSTHVSLGAIKVGNQHYHLHPLSFF